MSLDTVEPSPVDGEGFLVDGAPRKLFQGLNVRRPRCAPEPGGEPVELAVLSPQLLQQAEPGVADGLLFVVAPPRSPRSGLTHPNE